MKYLIIILSILLILSGCANKNNNVNTGSSDNSNISISRVSMDNNTTNVSITQPPKETQEEEISSYSTKILIHEQDRQDNVKIACSELRGKVVNPGETFSFNGTMGPATPEEGYKKADTFDKNGNIIQEYGGGKCQISSTLYNAVLKVPGLTVTERHEHSRDVDYVPERTRRCCCIWKC